MVRRAYAQRSLFEVLLPDGDKLWTDELRTIDELLMTMSSWIWSTPPSAAVTR
jgi:hypothetical protein